MGRVGYKIVAPPKVWGGGERRLQIAERDISSPEEWMGRLQGVLRAIFFNQFTDPAPDHHVTDKHQAKLIGGAGGLCDDCHKHRTEDECHNDYS